MPTPPAAGPFTKKVSQRSFSFPSRERWRRPAGPVTDGGEAPNQHTTGSCVIPRLPHPASSFVGGRTRRVRPLPHGGEEESKGHLGGDNRGLRLKGGEAMESMPLRVRPPRRVTPIAKRGTFIGGKKNHR